MTGALFFYTPPPPTSPTTTTTTQHVQVAFNCSILGLLRRSDCQGKGNKNPPLGLYKGVSPPPHYNPGPYVPDT